MDYLKFLESKRIVYQSAGLDVSRDKLSPLLFEFQKDLTWWNLKKGRSADFAGTGLGKTFIQSEWADKVNQATGENVLILAPLAVSQQTVREAARLGIIINPCRTQDDVKPGI
ncbi:MAG TPA: helicase, partial [Firmicutes bacterium]|nr:helicase [Bacillota bacterium]